MGFVCGLMWMLGAWGEHSPSPARMWLQGECLRANERELGWRRTNNGLRRRRYLWLKAAAEIDKTRYTYVYYYCNQSSAAKG